MKIKLIPEIVTENPHSMRRSHEVRLFRASDALYRFFDCSGNLLYVGITKNTSTRWRTHARKKSWWREVSRISLEFFETRKEAEGAETVAIVMERPKYNIRGNAAMRSARLGRSDFRERQKGGQVEVQRDYNTLVSESAVIRHFEVAYIPGLLQTADYARRVFEEQVMLHGGIDDVEAAVATRLERQRWLYDPTKQFEFLLTESVLRLVLPSTAVMRGQLDRLQTVIGVSNVRFGIVPFGVPLPTTPQEPIQMYDDLAIIEGFLGEAFHRGEDAERLARVFELLWQEAVEGDAARRLIVRALEALPGP